MVAMQVLIFFNGIDSMHRDVKTLTKDQTIGMQYFKAVKISATIFQIFSRALFTNLKCCKRSIE